MKLFDQPFKSPEENLACDEALLEMCENGAEGEILRLWEPKDYFAVLGYSNKANEELCLRSFLGSGLRGNDDGRRLLTLSTT